VGESELRSEKYDGMMMIPAAHPSSMKTSESQQINKGEA
jgi:hypothetical protein